MAPSPIKHVFITEWSSLTRSRSFRRRVAAWTKSSGGLLDGQSAQEIVEIIQSKQEPAFGSQVATWLLARADRDLDAARILLQAMSRTVHREVAQMNRNTSRLSRLECEALCISAAGMSIASKAGLERGWPMWALYGAMRQEIRSIDRASHDHLPLSPGTLDSIFAAPTDCRAAVELGLLLKHAAAVGTISLENAQLVFLRSVCGVPHQRLADDLGISCGSVRKRHTRIIRTLTETVAA